MKLRSHLLVLTLVTMIPILLFAVAGGAFMAARERATFQQGATERARALMTAVDAELHGSLMTLEALATSRSLDTGDFQGFREEARRVLQTQPGWLNITVASASGALLENALVPRGGRLPAVLDPQAIERVARTGMSQVGPVHDSVLNRRPAFAVRVPVVKNGRVKYVLSAVVDPSVIGRLLLKQDSAADWVAGVLDGNGRFVVRTPSPPKGQQFASRSMLEALEKSSQGWFLGRTLEGVEAYRSFIRSPWSAWTVAIAIPSRTVNAGAMQALWLFAVGTAAAVALALLFAWTLSRRIIAPIVRLSREAKALGVSEPARIPRTSSVSEVAQLSDALYEAAVAVREREDSLHAAARAKDEFLGMLGHELRNPLAALQSSAHLLKMAGPNRNIAVRAQAVIERQVCHMARLVDDLLDVTRVTSGKIKLSRTRLDLGALAARIVQAWRDSGRFQQHRVSSRIEPVWVDADTTRLEQILSNLLDNALKYTPRGGRISVRVHRAGSDALLEIRDTGQGLPGDLIHKVFNLFVQGERSLDREQGGLGIGLTLVRRLAELHGGSVCAASPGPGAGSTFTVKLPALSAPAHGTPSAQPARSGPGRRVLLIEDNADARQALGLLLELEGHEVHEAESGSQGIEMARTGRFDAAVVDIGLPGLDGYEVARRLKSTASAGDLFLIALTGYSSDEDRNRALAAGFDAHLAKPLEPGHLERVLERLAA